MNPRARTGFGSLSYSGAADEVSVKYQSLKGKGEEANAVYPIYEMGSIVSIDGEC